MTDEIISSSWCRQFFKRKYSQMYFSSCSSSFITSWLNNHTQTSWNIIIIEQYQTRRKQTLAETYGFHHEFTLLLFLFLPCRVNAYFVCVLHFRFGFINNKYQYMVLLRKKSNQGRNGIANNNLFARLFSTKTIKRWNTTVEENGLDSWLNIINVYIHAWRWRNISTYIDICLSIICLIIKERVEWWVCLLLK